MRLRLVLLAEAAVGVGAGGVEVAEADAGQAVDGVIPAQQRLHHDLRLAVCVHRLNRERLENRRRRRISVDRRGRRKHDVRARRCATIASSSDSDPADVVPEVLPRVLHRLANRDKRREVDHRFGAELLHQLGERGGLQQVDLEQPSRRHVVLIALGQVIDYRDVIALVEEQADGVRADIARSAGYEDLSFSH